MCPVQRVRAGCGRYDRRAEDAARSRSQVPARDISLPSGVEDVADLGMLADGKERFEIAKLEASALTAEAPQAALAAEAAARRELAEQRNKR